MQNQNNLTSAKRRSNCDTSGYTDCVLDLVAKRCDELGCQNSVKNYSAMIASLCGGDRTSYQKKIESEVAKALSDSIVCEGCSDCRRDAAAVLTVSDLVNKSDVNPDYNPSKNDICVLLLGNLKKMGVKCLPVSMASSSSMSGMFDQKSTETEQNINTAFLSLGINPKKLTPHQKSLANALKSAAKSQRSSGTPVDFKAKLIDYGVQPKPSNTMFMAYVQNKGLAGVWPVPPPGGPFEFGMGLDRSLGFSFSLGEEESKKPKPEDFITGTQSGDAMLVALTAGLVNLGVQYTQSQIDMAKKESELRLAKKYKEIYGTDPNDGQLNQFAANNPQQAAAAFSQGMAAAGISQSDVDAAVAKALAENKGNDKTIVYLVAGGVGLLALMGTVVLATRK